MIVFLVVVILELVVIVSGHIDLTADYRLDYEIAFGILVALVIGVLEELLHAVHIAVVGDGDRRHTQLTRTLEQLGDIRESIQDGILGMNVKMGERHRCKYKKEKEDSLQTTLFFVSSFLLLLLDLLCSLLASCHLGVEHNRSTDHNRSVGTDKDTEAEGN